MINTKIYKISVALGNIDRDVHIVGEVMIRCVWGSNPMLFHSSQVLGSAFSKKNQGNRFYQIPTLSMKANVIYCYRKFLGILTLCNSQDGEQFITYSLHSS